MARKTTHVKCAYCNEKIPIELVCIVESTYKKGLNKGSIKINKVHRECADDFKELLVYRDFETSWFDKVHDYIKGLLCYSDEQKLPNFLITRIQDLRNGTTLEKGEGRVVKYKHGYEYEIILDTFLTHEDKIKWAFDNKIFTSEKNKIAYMMTIIESNINDSYIAFENKLKAETIKKRDGMIEEESFAHVNSKASDNTSIIHKRNSGISKFLEEDEI